MNQHRKAAEVISQIRENNGAYCKFLSANDTGENGSHQNGFLISNAFSDWFLTDEEKKSPKPVKKDIVIRWPDGVLRDHIFTYYPSKKENRITSFGHDFPFRRPDLTGSLFVLTRKGKDLYQVEILESDIAIDDVLSEFSLYPTSKDLLRLKHLSPEPSAASLKENPYGLPVPSIVAREARDSISDLADPIECPDKTFLSWLDADEKLFRKQEEKSFESVKNHGFEDLENFLNASRSFLDNRRYRTRKTPGEYLKEIFIQNDLSFSSFTAADPESESEFVIKPECGGPDIILSVRYTCNDIPEDIFKNAHNDNQESYLFTLQQGLPEKTVSELEQHNIHLVVPEPYHKFYASRLQDRLMSLKEFLSHARQCEPADR